MTNPDDRLLITTEGVDEGSAASTVEGPGTGASPAAGPAGSAGPDPEPPAPPVDLETDETRPSGPGQQLEAGEG